MADGLAALEAQIARVRSLGQMVPRVAPEVARAVDREIAEQIGRGVGPGGEEWRPTKEGKQPLKNAARAMRVRAIGTVVLATLEGHHARHHLGAVKGGIRRPILPTTRVPDPVVKAIKTVVEDEFKKTMGVQR